MWKRLTHPNIVPLLGVTITPLQLVSGRMPGGTLPQYIKKEPDADRLAFVSPSTSRYSILTTASSSPTFPRAFTIFILVMQSTAISRVYVVI